MDIEKLRPCKFCGAPIFLSLNENSNWAPFEYSDDAECSIIHDCVDDYRRKEQQLAQIKEQKRKEAQHWREDRDATTIRVVEG